MSLSGAPAPHPFTLHANAVVAQALDIFRRTLDEETARKVEDPEAVRAALRRHFAVEKGGKVTFASSIDLAGHQVIDDDPHASAYWLPVYDAMERHDSAYRRTVKGVGSEPHLLAQQCARLMGPDAAAVLQWLRRASLDNGLAAELVDADGKALANGGDAFARRASRLVRLVRRARAGRAPLTVSATCLADRRGATLSGRAGA